jgi:hypothetical protein
MADNDFSDKILHLVTSKVGSDKTLQANLAREFDFPEYEGFYVKTGGKYYLASHFDIKWEFGFNKLADVKYAPIEREFELYVYRRNWHPAEAAFFSQELALVNHDYAAKQLAPHVKPVADNLYQLMFEGLEANKLLIIRDHSGLFTIGLGNVLQRLIHVFSSAEAEPHVVVSNLKDALRSFPDNETLSALLPLWEERHAQARAESTWQAVMAEWEKFEGATDPDTKAVFASNTDHEIELYLNTMEQPEHIERAGTLQQAIKDFHANNIVSTTDIPVPDRSEVSSSVTRYRSQSLMNLIITFVDVGDEGDVLIRFKGLPNEHDNKVYRHKKAIQNDSTGAFIYQTKELDGSNWNTFMYENDGWNSSTSIYPLGIEEQADVYMDNDEADEKIESADQLYGDYVARIQAS